MLFITSLTKRQHIFPLDARQITTVDWDVTCFFISNCNGLSLYFGILTRRKANGNGDVVNWEFFRQQCVDNEVATELSTQNAAVCLGTLRSVIGKECLQIFRNLALERQASVKSCPDQLLVYFKLRRNVVYETYVFNSSLQSQDESVLTKKGIHNTTIMF